MLRAISKTPPPRDPVREALAAAIIQADAAKRAEEASSSAVRRAAAMVEEAEEKLRGASADVAKAKGVQAARIAAAAASGEALAPDRSLKDARARETDATDDLEAVRSALASIEAAAGEATYQANRSANRALDAAKAIVAGEADRLMREIAELEQRSRAKRAALSFMSSKCFGWPQADEERRVESFLGAEIYPGVASSHPTFAEWSEALSKLVQDANAALPE